jgi:hypothetical protein
MRAVVTVGLLAAMAGCGMGPESEAGEITFGGGARPTAPTTPGTPGTPVLHTVGYLVTGTATRADITYANAQGGTQQQTVGLPWAWQAQVAPGALLYISAQSKDLGREIEVQIGVGSAVVKTSQSAGDYVIATASHTCC